MENLSDDLRQKLDQVKLLVLDVDGVLTDGKITYSLTPNSEIQESKSYNVKDGQGLSLLIKANIKTAIITARISPINEHRAKELGFHYIEQNIKKKLDKLSEIAKELNIDFSEIAYMGDDLPDLKPLQAVGLPCCPADAMTEIKENCLFISQYNGGNGAVRELTDLILKTQNKYPIIKPS